MLNNIGLENRFNSSINVFITTYGPTFLCRAKKERFLVVGLILFVNNVKQKQKKEPYFSFMFIFFRIWHISPIPQNTYNVFVKLLTSYSRCQTTKSHSPETKQNNHL